MTNDEEQAELDRLFDQLMNGIADIDEDLEGEEAALERGDDEQK